MTNTEWMREGYARYSRRDFTFADDMFAEDVQWDVPGFGHLDGRAAVREFFDGLAGQFASHTITLVDAVEAPDRLVCFVRHDLVRHDGGGGSVEGVHDWTIRDGRVAAMHEIADTMAFAVASGQMPAPSA